MSSSVMLADSNYGVRSIDSSFEPESAPAPESPAPLGLSESARSSSSSETTYAVLAAASKSSPRPGTPAFAPVASIARSARLPGSPSSFASEYDHLDHLSDASRTGLLSAYVSDAEDAVRASSRSGSDHEAIAQQSAESQLVMPTLLLRANDIREQASANDAIGVPRFGAIGHATVLLGGLFGSSLSDLDVLEWPLDVDPLALLKRLEAAFIHAQRLLRDDIPRDLRDTLVRALVNLPDLAGLDALVLPLDIPPAAAAIELAAALHPFVNLILVVGHADEEAVAALDSQLTSQGIHWLSPRCFGGLSSEPFFRLPPSKEGDPFQPSSVANYSVPELQLLRRRSLNLFLRWRAVDLAARSESDYLYPLKDAAFAEQVARRRTRLADEEEMHSSADSGDAADDEGAGQSVHQPRPRQARLRRKHCGPFDDPLAFDFISLSRLGLRAASKALRISANVILVGGAVVAIFGAGLGIGWISSNVLAGFGQQLLGCLKID